MALTEAVYHTFRSLRQCWACQTSTSSAATGRSSNLGHLRAHKGSGHRATCSCLLSCRMTSSGAAPLCFLRHRAPSAECHTSGHSSSVDLLSTLEPEALAALSNLLSTQVKMSAVGPPLSTLRAPKCCSPICATLSSCLTKCGAFDCRFFPAWCFVLPKALFDIPFAIWQTTLWVCIHYFAVGFSKNAGRQVCCRVASHVPCHLDSV